MGGRRRGREVARESGVWPADCLVGVHSQIRTLSVERIGAKRGRATPEELALAVEGFNEIIGIQLWLVRTGRTLAPIEISHPIARPPSPQAGCDGGHLRQRVS